MKLWMVGVHYNYEGTEFAGIYTTEEAAQKRKAELVKKGYGDSIIVEEVETDVQGGGFETD